MSGIDRRALDRGLKRGAAELLILSLLGPRPAEAVRRVTGDAHA